MKSMTGFAKKQCEIKNRKITIEIKTLNSKTLDLNVKLPLSLHSKELEIRSLIAPLERGKIDVYVTEETDRAATTQLDSALAEQRFRELAAFADSIHADRQRLFDTIAAMPDVWTTAEVEDLDDEDWDILQRTFREAVQEVDAFRSHEGAILQQDFVKHVDLIEQKLQAIPQYEAERIDTARERIRRYFAESAIKEMNRERFEQELIYYLEKLDITEEKIRLAKHIDYFRHTMAEEEGSGKKLGFIAQEMGREINTTGSKANHVDIQRLVVEMKDELEKIKEQLGNIL